MLTANFAAGRTWRNSHRKSEGAAVLRITDHRRGNSKSRIVNSKSKAADRRLPDSLEELNRPALQQRGRDNGLQDPKD
jgi:hypothetical protein